jgi:hypothetical protein
MHLFYSGFVLLRAGLSDSSSKVQVSAVNILNLALSQPDAAAELAPCLQAEESTLLAALSGLLDHSLALLRAKALATIMLLCRWGSHWSVSACQVPYLSEGGSLSLW